MGNIFGMMINIIQENFKIIYQMAKALNIIQMVIFYMKVILLMVYLKVMENIFMIMVIILLGHIKMV